MQNRTWLKGLTIECPYGKELESCPIEKLRIIPFVKCVDMINNLDEKRVGDLIEHHKECWRKREGD